MPAVATEVNGSGGLFQLQQCRDVAQRNQAGQTGQLQVARLISGKVPKRLKNRSGAEATY